MLTGTHAVLIDRGGVVVLAYDKPVGTFTAPTAGTNRAVASLKTSNCSVVIALTLGFDYLFPETVRAVLPLGAQLVLNPVSVSLTDTDLQHLHVLAYDNRVFIATANYATSTGTPNTPYAGSQASAGTPDTADAGNQASAGTLETADTDVHQPHVAAEDTPNGRSGLTSDLAPTRPIGGNTTAGGAPGVFVYTASIADLPKSISGDDNRKPYKCDALLLYTLRAPHPLLAQLILDTLSFETISPSP
jgi:hypothetical protein